MVAGTGSAGQSQDTSNTAKSDANAPDLNKFKTIDLEDLLNFDNTKIDSKSLIDGDEHKYEYFILQKSGDQYYDATNTDEIMKRIRLEQE